MTTTPTGATLPPGHVPEPYEWRDETVIPAPAEALFDAVTDLGAYGEWMTLCHCEPLGETQMAPGVRFEFSGGDEGERRTAWVIEVESLERPTRIDLRYAEGDLVGPVSWEFEPVDGGTRIAYVYRGVRATTPQAKETFATHGMMVHSIAVHEDMFAGLAAYVRGETLDDAARARVVERMTSRVAAL